MIVGQETNGWGEGVDRGQKPEDVVAELQAWYADFDLGRQYRATPFWAAAHYVHERLNAGQPDSRFVWTNLVKLDNRGRPSAPIEEAISRLNLSLLEIQTFSPEIVIFFTGPRYDGRLLATFPGAEIEPLTRTIAKVTHEMLPQRTFRTYHPRYLRMSKQWRALDDLTSYCKSPDETLTLTEDRY